MVCPPTASLSPLTPLQASFSVSESARLCQTASTVKQLSLTAAAKPTCWLHRRSSQQQLLARQRQAGRTWHSCQVEGVLHKRPLGQTSFTPMGCSARGAILLASCHVLSLI